MTACEKKSEPAPAAPDTSGAMKKPDTSGQTGETTLMDQSESSAAIAITAAIRRAIMDDSTLTLAAQNITIITDAAGVVTLKGVVGSQAEKDLIENKAKAVPGVTKVDNQLQIKTN